MVSGGTSSATQNGESKPTFALNSGEYRYEFNIVHGPDFTLRLSAEPSGSADAIDIRLVPSTFREAGGTVARKAAFELP
jgi:hypothetical protein